MGVYLGTVPVTPQGVRAVYAGTDLVWQAVAPSVTMTVEGTTLEPVLELVEGSTATLTWTDDAGAVLATGTTPAITLPDATPRTVHLAVSEPGDVVTFNLGFHEDQDNGIYSLPSSYRHPTQPVTTISGLPALTGLRNFMAARTDGSSSDSSLYTGPLLSGHLDLAGASSLEFVECYDADVESVTLTGCASLIRLCLERCHLTTLDLEPVRTTLRDLRAAVQAGGSLALAPLSGPLTDLYHFCTRAQTLTGFPGGDALPAIRQLWTWRNGLDEDELVIRSSAALHSVRIGYAGDSELGPANQVRSLDLAGQTWGPLSGPQQLWAYGIGMQHIDITAMGAVGDLRLHDNVLPTADVDHVLEVVDAWGTSDGNLTLAGNAAPTDTTHTDALAARGWTLTFEPPSVDPDPGDLLWSDEFDRPDAAGWANSGGWYPGPGETDTDVNVAGGGLRLSGPGGYRRWLHPADTSLPADFEVEIGWTNVTAGRGGYWGVCARVGTDGSGVKAFVAAAAGTDFRTGDAATYSDGVQTDISGVVPPTWTDVGDHSLRMRCEGDQITAFIDDVQVQQVTFAHNSTLSGGAVGFCGEAQNRTWGYIRVRAI